MVRPLGRPLARKAVTLEDLREDFLAHCEARNLSERTLEWYGDRTRRFADWCAAQGIAVPSDLRCSDLEQFVLHCRRQGFAPNTVHGYAQVLKSLCRLGHREGYIPEDITTRFELPRVPRTIVPTFSDEQLQAVLAVPDRRTWLGIRDRAMLLVFLDTLMRVSDLVGLDARGRRLGEGVIRVMGKGGKDGTSGASFGPWEGDGGLTVGEPGHRSPRPGSSSFCPAELPRAAWGCGTSHRVRSAASRAEHAARLERGQGRRSTR